MHIRNRFYTYYLLKSYSFSGVFLYISPIPEKCIKLNTFAENLKGAFFIFKFYNMKKELSFLKNQGCKKTYTPAYPKALLVIFILLINTLSFAQTGTWTKVTNLAPHYNMGVMLLLTDGTVLCHNSAGGTYGTGWDKLTPDATGSYVNGTWTTMASMTYDRLFFSSQVLPSGKVYVAGGEYGPGGTYGEVYDPAANSWTTCGPIPGGWNIYDGNSQLLYTGNVLEGPQIGANSSYNILQWSPGTLNYTTESNSPLNHDEAEWVKMPDSSVLFIGIASTNSCRYLPQTNSWMSDATVPVSLYDTYGEEAGCGCMLPNGKAIFFGATKYNAIYTPTGHPTMGSWSAAANFPTINGTQVGQPDASGAMMVNGHILLAVSPVGTSNADEFRSPTYFVEYDYTTNTFTQVTATIPGQGCDSLAGVGAYMTNMLALPDGNILVSIDQTNISKQYYIYTPGSAAIAAGKPTINSILPDGCPNYKITGKLFNGISEGAAYGDDWQMSTNYPLVRLSNGTDVYYAKTTNWNRIAAVQTDSLEDTAIFAMPVGLPAGTYSLTVVVNGFASNPTIYKTLGITISSHTNVLCNGGTGSATANAATGGLSPYTYLWSPSGGSSVTATGLTAGAYTITVTDNNGCTATANVTITQPTALSISMASTANVLCYGGNTGSATANAATGGTSPYTYSWAPSGGTNLTASGLTAGTYTITAKDNNGCTATVSASISQPTQLTVSASVNANVSCSGGNTGSASATAGGGISPYTYAWSGGGTNAIKTGLTAGAYSVVLKDSNGCTASASVTITQPTPLIVSASTIANINCNGGNTGSVLATAGGGTSPYTYSWSGGGTNASHTGLTAGTYTITLKDNNGCSATASTIITQPAPLAASASVTANVSCNGGSNGSVSSTHTGGTSPFTYLWSAGGTNATESSLTAGTYTITIHDNCGASATAQVSVTQPAPLTVSTTVNANVSCNGGSNGSASATPSGGVSPYTYAWSGGGSNSTKSALTAATYTITVKDKNGCSASALAIITQPTAVSILMSNQTNEKCNGAATGTALAASATGGTSPYSYNWTPSGGTNLGASNLSAGTYTITATDINGCTASTSATITQPAAIAIVTDSVDESGTGGCNGKAWVKVSGGLSPYSYVWNPGSGSTDTIKNLCAGKYCCTITDANGCTSSACVTITNNTGIETISNASDITVYPDPTNGSFTITGIVQGQIIELYNSLGQLLSSTKAYKTTTYYNISGKSDGLYLIRVLNNDGSLVTQKKIIKTE